MTTALRERIIDSIREHLSESASLTNGEALKIGKKAKAEAEKIRKRGGPLAANDADYLDGLASDAFARDLKAMVMTMNGGETDNREDAFRVVASVIGKDRAQALSRHR
jgi:hypothetical protein